MTSKKYTADDTMDAEAFAHFCRVHGKSATRLGAFVRTACLVQAAIDILKRD